MPRNQRPVSRFLPTYATLVGLPALALLVIIRVGERVARTAQTATLSAGEPGSVAVAVAAGPAAPVPDLPLLLVQIIVILVAARLVGLLVRRLGQPQVVGEMMAGIALGPSLLGARAPGIAAALFPPNSLGLLNALSQIGLLVFMFLIGLELDPKVVRERGRSAIVISHASIVAPFLLGAILAIVLHPTLSGKQVGLTGFALFMGAAMSVTAFPVLARILTERRLLRTPIGAVAVACAAIDDITAWCILAAVVVIVRATGSHVSGGVPLWLTLAGSGAFVVFMLTVGKRALRTLETRYARKGRVTQDTIAVLVLALLASAWITERLGIHALFGAFLVGAVSPKTEGFVRAILERFEDTMVVPWRDAAVIGVLLNTRGLMELVILNVGLDIGVISRELFAMMVLMALATTFMTTPLVAWLLGARAPDRADLPSTATPAR